MDFIEEPVHIQDIIPEIVRILEREKGRQH